MDMACCHLDGNADRVEFCPETPFHDIVAAGTYSLDVGVQPMRSGSISIFRVETDEGRLDLHDSITTSGVFDVKWKPTTGGGEPPMVAQAGSDGYLKLYTMNPSAGGSSTHSVKLVEIGEEEVTSSSMCVSLDWNSSGTAISVGHADGFISVLSVAESRLVSELQWRGHEFELWATSFDAHRPLLVYTGGDDCKFICWDTRCTPLSPAFQNSTTHTMGVCCIAPSQFEQHSVLTGSYDEQLRMWDLRVLSGPVCAASSGLGGGLWRIKHHPNVRGIILTACMHNGFALVDVNGERPTVIETYKKHESLAYGADWMKGEMGEKRSVVATCSFYDNHVRVWSPNSVFI